VSLIRKPPPNRPWFDLPNEMRDTLAPVLEETISRVVMAVEVEVPQYRAVADSPVRQALMAGVRVALTRLLELLGTQEAALAGAYDLYEGIGAAEYRSRRPLEDVLSAYRVGATTTWQGLSRAAVGAGFSPRDIAALAEACFAYINEIAGASTAGYVRAQSADAGARARVRTQLLESLLSGEGRTAATAGLGRRARWTIPETVSAVSLDGVPESLMDELNDSAAILAAHTESGDIALVRTPISSNEISFLDRKLSQHPTTIGTPQPISRVAHSLNHAQTLTAHRLEWHLPQTGLLWARDHLAALLLQADPELADQLRQDSLEPLLALPPERSAQLLETLKFWLLHQGARKEVAETLAVHPQTVSYRMDQIRHLMGSTLDQSEARFGILLALMSTSPTARPPSP
jgi:hypothetical protein